MTKGSVCGIMSLICKEVIEMKLLPRRSETLTFYLSPGVLKRIRRLSELTGSSLSETVYFAVCEGLPLMEADRGLVLTGEFEDEWPSAWEGPHGD